MAIAEIITGIRATWAAAGTAIDARDAVKLNEVKLAMSNQLLELYTAVFALLDAKTASDARTRDLEAEVVQLRERAIDKARYKLEEPYPGTIVYALREDDATGEPHHYICPGCLENRSVKSIIQFSYKSKVMGSCHECGKQFRFADNPTFDVSRLAGGSTSWMGR